MVVVQRKKTKQHLYIVMAISFIIASVLSVYPLSAEIALFRPMWMIMMLIFWLIFQPTLIGMGLAFVVGLFADLLTDSRIGQQALCAVLVAFFIKFVSGYLRQLSSNLVWLLAGACLLIYQFGLIFLHLFTQGVFAPQLLYTVAVSTLIWPLLVAVMLRYTR
ncbi:MAG: rod shape-determining protein MreD [Moraxella osloensis]|jgi:rod shape-determining protein MreD|nr:MULTISPECIES: rod shape-determining protein MreD [Moraxella]MBD3728019.1 rod shape-determining protein MreD [Moraxella osloensis]MBW4018217.1 rod shape-determining protein MreD [Moraxella osloensis]ONG39269.1 rod shape-determining protein MreD [Enhydrobacter sp. H5]